MQIGRKQKRRQLSVSEHYKSPNLPPKYPYASYEDECILVIASGATTQQI